MKFQAEYQASLQSIPVPGGGCHPALLRVANYGALSGLTPKQVEADIRQAIPQGGRRVPDKEIQDAVKKAFCERDQWQPSRSTAWTPHNADNGPRVNFPKLLRKIMAEGSDNEADLWESSPVRLDGKPEDDSILLLKHFYRPDDFLFLGDTFDKRVRTAGEWVQLIEKHGTAQLPFIVPNVFDGNEHETSAGTMSCRCDAAVESHRFAVVEFDNIPRDKQLRFWSGIIRRNLLNVACLIDSGNKSLHAWVRVNVSDRAAWNLNIKQKLFEKWLIPLGVDKSTKNPSRLSRLPGHKRTKTKRWQRLLWLQ